MQYCKSLDCGSSTSENFRVKRDVGVKVCSKLADDRNWLQPVTRGAVLSRKTGFGSAKSYPAVRQWERLSDIISKMPDKLNLTESIVRSQVSHFGWIGFFVECLKYSWEYLLAFSVWICFSLVAHLSLVWFLWGVGFLPIQKQVNPAARPWAALLLIPLALGLGFLAKLIDSKTWVIRPDGIVIRSTIKDGAVKAEQIAAIAIEDSEHHEVWTIETNDGSEAHFAVFLKTAHNDQAKRQLFESEHYDGLVDLIYQTG